MNDTFMKEKPIFPLLVSMALPMVISMLVNALYNIVDSLFVAQISEDAMTALSTPLPSALAWASMRRLPCTWARVSIKRRIWLPPMA